MDLDLVNPGRHVGRPRRAGVHVLAVDLDLGVRGLDHELHHRGRLRGRCGLRRRRGVGRGLRRRCDHVFAATARREEHRGSAAGRDDERDRDDDPRLAAAVVVDHRGADYGL